jgi:hypothetical protein
MINGVEMATCNAHRVLSAVVACVFIAFPVQTNAAVTVYTNEAEFLAAVSALDLEVTSEGFEDDAVWGESRVTLEDRIADMTVPATVLRSLLA